MGKPNKMLAKQFPAGYNPGISNNKLLFNTMLFSIKNDLSGIEEQT